jgi:hypothetical protein
MEVDMGGVIRKRIALTLVLAVLILGGAGLGVRAYSENLPSCDSLGPLVTTPVGVDNPYTEVTRWCRGPLGIPWQEKLSGSISIETPSPAEMQGMP